MPPNTTYSIHLVHPDTTYTFYTYESVLYFLDTTHLITKEQKYNYVRDFRAAQEEITRINASEQPGSDIAFAVVCGVLIVLGLLLSYFINRPFAKYKKQSAPLQINPEARPHLVYKGYDLDFDIVTLEIICLKYNAFFRTLDKTNQNHFIKQLQHFMHRKQFWMQGENCYREMPVLLSATAMQLCFGINDFWLDSYPIIIIQPEAYFGYEPLRILTGNVQGNTITVSWKHFLADHLDEDDGNNVGLHEMAHAFAMQLLYVPAANYQQVANRLRVFYEKLEEFIIYEKQKSASLFDAYSLQNADECWAKCIELFFEKREELAHYYPELYSNVRKILNQ